MVVVTGFFIVLSAACSVATKALLGMLLIWLSGSLPCSKRK